MYIKYTSNGGALSIKQITTIRPKRLFGYGDDGADLGSFADVAIRIDSETGFEEDIETDICLFDSPGITLKAFNALCEAIAEGKHLFDVTVYQKMKAGN